MDTALTNPASHSIARLAMGILLFAASLPVASCGDASTAPRTGSMVVTVTTAGIDVDPTGYVMLVDSATGHHLGANATITIPGIAPGMHTIRLADVDANCAIDGDTEQRASIAAGETVTVGFSVTCVERVGEIAVNTATSGTELAPARYALSVDSGAAQPITVNGSLAIRVREGIHLVTLSGVGENCYTRGTMSRPAVVAFNRSEPVRFDITCAPRVEVRITTATDGDDAGNGYRLIATAEDSSRTDSLALPLNGVVTVRLFAGTYTVALAGVVANCQLQGDGPRRVVVTPGTTPVIEFAIGCKPARQIAFVRDGQVYLVNSDGSGLVQVGSGEQPAWSSDGQRLAVVRNGAIWIMYADGSGAHVVTAASSFDARSPAWSPDGREIAFSAQQDGHTVIFVVSVADDGAPVRRVGFDSGQHIWPAWSPDGRTIAFVSDWAMFDTAYDIYLVNAAGSEPVQVTDGLWGNVSTWPSWVVYAQPAWSPDGQRIALVACPEWQPITCNASSIAVMNADGSNMRTLSAAGGLARPTWSPNGRMIAFATDCYDNNQCGEAQALRVLPADGSDTGVIISRGRDPAWRP